MSSPWDAIGNVILGFIRDKRNFEAAQGWTKLIFQMALSSIIAFLSVGGGMMVKTKSIAVGVGTGMMAAAVCLTYFFRRSKETQGMTIVIPQDEATQELNSDLQVITRNGGTK